MTGIEMTDSRWPGTALYFFLLHSSGTRDRRPVLQQQGVPYAGGDDGRPEAEAVRPPAGAP